MAKVTLINKGQWNHLGALRSLISASHLGVFEERVRLILEQVVIELTAQSEACL